MTRSVPPADNSQLEIAYRSLWHSIFGTAILSTGAQPLSTFFKELDEPAAAAVGGLPPRPPV